MIIKLPKDLHNSQCPLILTFLIFQPTTEEVEDRFATLRPAQFVRRQMQEHKSDAYREQLQVYKRYVRYNMYVRYDMTNNIVLIQ